MTIKHAEETIKLAATRFDVSIWPDDWDDYIHQLRKDILLEAAEQLRDPEDLILFIEREYPQDENATDLSEEQVVDVES